MATSKHLFLFYVTLLSALCAVAAPVNYDTASSVGARGNDAVLNARAVKAPPPKALPVKASPAKASLVKTSTAKATPVKSIISAATIKSTTPAATVKSTNPVATVKSVTSAGTVKATTSSGIVKATASTSISSSASTSLASSASTSLASSATLSVTATTTASNGAATSGPTCPIKKKTITPAVKAPRNLHKRAPLTGTGEHQVSLLRYAKGTDHEHWALFFHPSAADATGTFTGTRVDVIIEDANVPDAVLVVAEESKKFKPSGQTRTITPFATLANGATAEKLLTKARRVQLTQKPPTQNCVDWTSLAVNAMGGRTRGSLTAAEIATFQAVYNADKDAVRTRTACNFACQPVPANE